MDELTKLKYWLDSEISINHLYYLLILGILLGGKWWLPVGFMMILNLGYALRRTSVLPKDYLRVKHERR